jgi:lysine-N-methylase
MPMPIRPLPVVQNWDCHGCTNCCRSYNVRVSDTELAKLQALGWADDPDLQGQPPSVLDAAVGGHRLSQRADGTCVFLNPDGRCRLHLRFGATAKPAACRIFPFTFSPVGTHWQVGARFSCPSIVQNRGRPLVEHREDLKTYAHCLESEANGRVKSTPPPPLNRGVTLAWSDYLRMVQTLDQLLAADSVSIETRLRQILAVITLWKSATYEKLRGSRLSDFLEVTATALREDVPSDPHDVPSPSRLGRVLFRQTAAIYSRQDNGPEAGIGRRGRWTRIRAAWRFAWGMGPVPRLHGRIPEGVRFAECERPTGPLPADAEALLTRYYRVKIGSVQFAGSPNFGAGFWDGLSGLLLTCPVILWLARVLQRGHGPVTLESLQTAVRVVDDGFGFNPLLGTPRQIRATRLLADRGELSRLIAWYAR